jgi:uncharacterized protein YfcZ (UPF0381/DUF406 family)
VVFSGIYNASHGSSAQFVMIESENTATKCCTLDTISIIEEQDDEDAYSKLSNSATQDKNFWSIAECRTLRARVIPIYTSGFCL